MKKLSIFFMACFMCCMLCVPTFAYQINGIDVASPIEIYEEQKEAYPYGLVTNEVDGIWMYLCKSPIEFTGSAYESTGSHFRMWKYNSNTGAWVTSGSNVVKLSLDVERNIVYSTHDVYHRDTGALYKTNNLDFFSPPPPLAEVIQGVTEETMQGTLPGLDGTMKVLVPCGVGLMALLTVLKLFGKRSLIFLR